MKDHHYLAALESEAKKAFGDKEVSLPKARELLGDTKGSHHTKAEMLVAALKLSPQNSSFSIDLEPSQTRV